MLSFIYDRTVRLQDTDAAGVVYFANVLSICHEAYEASLASSGIDLNTFFRGAIAIPILHAEADYWQPLICGQPYTISVTPTLLSPDKFEIKYLICAAESTTGTTAKPAAPNSPFAQAVTLHLCIDSATRKRRSLPPEIKRWLEDIPSNLDIASHTPIS